MVISALCNQKGGVGKTTTAVNIARAAHLRGLRALLVDLDPQGNTTSTVLGQELGPETESIADVLSTRSDATAKDVLQHTGWIGIDILPSGGDALADVSGELVTMGPGREHRLSEALTDLAGAYDLVLIDCPPSLDHLTINGLAAADQAVVVTTAAQFSLNGIARLMQTMRVVRQYNNPRLHVAGIVTNAVEERTRRQKHWLTDLHDNAPFQPFDEKGSGPRIDVWRPPIPKATWIGEAIEAGVGLDEWGTPAATVIAEIYDDYLTKMLASGGDY